MKRFALPLVLVMCGAAVSGQIVTPRSVLRSIAVKPTEVLVLATPHVGEIAAWNPALVTRLNAVLSAWHPNAIIVEQIPPKEIDAAVRGHDDREIVEAFAPMAIKLGSRMQQTLSIDAASARKEAAAPNGANGARLVELLLASDDVPSAVLEWTRLTNDQKAAFGEMPDVAKSLDELAASHNEIYAVAVPVARASGVARLDSADDHLDDVALSRLDPAELKPLIEHPLYKSTMTAPVYTTAKARLHDAAQKGDLLPYYLYVNSRRYEKGDISAQWGLFLRTNLPSGVDRYRFMLWEARNQAIAAKIAALIAGRHPDRVLVMFGAAHKPFLETDLAASPLIRLVQLDSIDAARTARRAGSQLDAQSSSAAKH